ncbi:twin-arginine translocase TatA/TatE family subunit [Alkaliphilus sp. MSJ-5]|uniref:Sec-independent protein translocase protein TatA n=1 Tax=Alkaliphilus flagellatus TaxID=2841507 RepID=A0ABS6G3X5_9FIRM|nr:twin-arginine translocase TatA/TatE family subunit [Alkaliphilus flagellatus]MBU5677184.1 twin-arginine translocase TatA/TatE family subunit [Alkaliphilus flagellatus]
MFGKIGTGELILILAIALIVVGPGKLPELGKTLGKSISEFKKFSNEIKEEISLEDKKTK